MKIVHLAGYLNERSSGVQKVVRGLSESQARLGHQVFVFGHIDKNDPSPIVWDDVNVSLFKKYPYGFSWGLIKNLRKVEPDVIHVHGLWQYNLIAAFLCGLKCNIYVTPHGMLAKVALTYSKYKKSLVTSLFQKKLLAKADGVQATSLNEMKEISEYCPSAKIFNIPNGVIFPKVNTNNRNKIVLTVGRVHKTKNLEFALNVLSKSEVFLNSGFVYKIVGPADINYLNYLKSLCFKLGISDKVIFTGEIKGVELQSVYASSMLFLLPSLTENYGIVVGEALMSSLPVLASSNTPWESLNDFGSGACLDLDVGTWISHIDHILSSSQEEFNIIGSNALKHASMTLGWEIYTPRILEMYRNE